MEPLTENPITDAELQRRLEMIEGVRELREAARGIDAYLVGGIVRDALRGDARADLDVVVEGPVGELARRLGGAHASHERFGTATVRIAGGVSVDLASARDETYARPGALPTVRPAGLDEDLARRDFTVNAMAVPLAEPLLIDPHGGARDLGEGTLRILGERSFVDDPTRAIRAARYVARLGLQPEPTTHSLLVRARMETVSADRIESEVRKLAAEDRAVEALALLHSWGLASVENPSLASLAARAARLEPWSALVDRATAILVAGEATCGTWSASKTALELARRLAEVEADPPSLAVHAARGADALALMLALLKGASWVEDYIGVWRHVRLSISGADLIAKGVEQGPAVGAGLEAALDGLIDGEISSGAQELERALEAARGVERR